MGTRGRAFSLTASGNMEADLQGASIRHVLVPLCWTGTGPYHSLRTRANSYTVNLSKYAPEHRLGASYAA